MSDVLKRSLFWLGPPSKYNTEDKTLAASKLPDGDLGGRYMALPLSVTPQQVFDTTNKLLQHFYQEASRRAAMSGQITAEIVFSDAICMTWVFASQEIARLTSRLDELEKRLKKLEPQEENV